MWYISEIHHLRVELLLSMMTILRVLHIWAALMYLSHWRSSEELDSCDRKRYHWYIPFISLSLSFYKWNLSAYFETVFLFQIHSSSTIALILVFFCINFIASHTKHYVQWSITSNNHIICYDSQQTVYFYGCNQLKWAINIENDRNLSSGCYMYISFNG